MAELITKVENPVFKDGIAQEDNSFSLNVGQEYAIRSIMNWYGSRHKPGWKKSFILGGCAGCVLPDTKIKVRKISNDGKHKINVIEK